LTTSEAADAELRKARAKADERIEREQEDAGRESNPSS
jgi:hypothetical protein